MNRHLALCAVLVSFGSPVSAECLFQPVSFAVVDPQGIKIYEWPAFRLLQTSEEALAWARVPVEGKRLVIFFGNHVALVRLDTREIVDRGEVICGESGGYVLWLVPPPKEPVENWFDTSASAEESR